MEKGIKELTEPKMVQEEKNMELQENFEKDTSKLESQNQVLKKEIKEIRESQHKDIWPPSVTIPRAGRQMLTPLLPRHLQSSRSRIACLAAFGRIVPSIPKHVVQDNISKFVYGKQKSLDEEHLARFEETSSTEREKG